MTISDKLFFECNNLRRTIDALCQSSQVSRGEHVFCAVASAHLFTQCLNDLTRLRYELETLAHEFLKKETSQPKL